MKTHSKIKFLVTALAAALLLGSFSSNVLADTVKTKDGKTYEGVISLDTADLLKIRVKKSATISETVTILKKDIAELIKSAPDDVDFAKLKNLIPTPSLMSASAYESMINKGPKAFLNSYPGSQHRAEVEKISALLNEELGKVKTGYMKLEGDWLSPQQQQDFKALIESRILNLGIKQKAQQRNFIGALRDFERMEENFYGTPAYPESVRAILSMLPIMGQQMQRMAKEVNFMNEEFERKLLLMPEQKREQTRQARNREEAAQKKAFEADKAGGIKWYRLNERDEEDLKAYITMVAAEIKRLEELNLTALSLQAEELVKADELIAEGKLEAAKEKLKEAGEMSTSAAAGATSASSGKKNYVSRSGRQTSRSSSKNSSKTSYVVKLQDKITKKEAAIAEAKAQEQNAAEGAQATQLVRSDAVDIVANDSGGETPETSETEKPSGGSALDSFISSGGSKSAGSNKDDAKSKNASKKTTRPPVKKPSKPAPDKKDDDDRREVASTGGGGGGFNIMYIVWGVTGLLVISVIVMKVTGIGGAKG